MKISKILGGGVKTSVKSAFKSVSLICTGLILGGVLSMQASASEPAVLKSKGAIVMGDDIAFDARDFTIIESAIETGKEMAYEDGRISGQNEVINGPADFGISMGINEYPQIASGSSVNCTVSKEYSGALLVGYGTVRGHGGKGVPPVYLKCTEGGSVISDMSGAWDAGDGGAGTIIVSSACIVVYYPTNGHDIDLVGYGASNNTAHMQGYQFRVYGIR